MQRINDKLKSLCKFCSSHLDKPCAWISLGNEYCDRIMDIQSELNNRIPIKDIEDKIEELENIKLCGGAVNKAICEEKIQLLKNILKWRN